MNNINLEKLSEYLVECNKNQITLSIDEIETIICTQLPDEALKSEWWWNISSSKRAKYWLSIGYKTIDAKYITYRRNVTFKKIEENETLKKENNLIHRFIYFLCNENYPTRKRIMAIFAIPVAVLSILASIYTIKSYYITNSKPNTQENNTFNNLYEIGKKHLEDENYEEAIKYLESSLKTYDDLNIPYNEDTIKVLYKLGDAYFKIALYNKAIDNYTKAISIIDSQNINKEDFFELYTSISYAYIRLSEYDKAEKYLNIAKSFFTDDEISKFENSIFFVYLEYYINEEKEDTTYRTALNFDLPDEENPMYFNANKLSKYLDIVEIEAAIDLRKGNYEFAALRYEQILSFWDYLKIYDIYDNNIKIAILYDSLSVCNVYLGNIEKAQKYNKLAINIFDEQFGKRNIDTGISYLNMGVTFLEIEEYDKAYEYLQLSNTILQDTIGNCNDNIATVYNNIANCLENMGKVAEAEEYYIKSIDIYNSLNTNSLNVFRTYFNYAICLMKQEKYEDATKFIDKAYAIAPLFLDEDSDEFKQCLVTRNAIYNLINMKNQ